jgi:APA family basic amino acid/polyamine antiporter
MGSGGVITEESPLIGRNHDDHELHRHLSLFDLVCVGVGATVGSGVFVLIGLIAHTSAGPGVFLSWSIAGLAACASGLCYAELGARFPSAGSSYVYAKETMGELASVIAAACLTLEYTGSASAVARSWGDKVVTYIRSRNSDSIFIPILDPGLGINPCAFVVSLGSVILLLKGVKESKSVTNFFSTLNVSLVLFMAVMSIILAKKENLSPLIPQQFGTSGILRGATSSFFGYIGFDEICCVSGEVKNPSENVPRAIILTLLIVTVLYISASLGLVGMVPYEQISETSGFPNGFRYAGYGWAAEMTAVSHVQILTSFSISKSPLTKPCFSLVN